MHDVRRHSTLNFQNLLLDCSSISLEARPVSQHLVFESSASRIPGHLMHDARRRSTLNPTNPLSEFLIHSRRNSTALIYDHSTSMHTVRPNPTLNPENPFRTFHQHPSNLDCSARGVFDLRDYYLSDNHSCTISRRYSTSRLFNLDLEFSARSAGNRWGDKLSTLRQSARLR